MGIMGETKTITQDPRQLDFLSRYLDPKSKTFSNIYQSAIDAGYAKSYAESFQVKSKEWLSENIGMVTKDKLVTKAKNNLDKLLDSADEKIQADITKFVAKADRDFSEKVDLTSNGESIQIPVVRIIDERRNPDTK